MFVRAHKHTFKNLVLFSSASPDFGILTKQWTNQDNSKHKSPTLQAAPEFKGLRGDKPQTAELMTLSKLPHNSFRSFSKHPSQQDRKATSWCKARVN